MNLAGVNQLSGGLDDFNMQAGGFIASRLFNVSGNGLNESDIPETWYSPTLVSMDISNNGVSGPMPAQWADPVNGQRSAFPSLKQLYIQGNNLSGAAGIRQHSMPQWTAGSAVGRLACIWRALAHACKDHSRDVGRDVSRECDST